MFAEGAEAIARATGFASPGHLASSFLDGKFRDARPSPSSFSLDEPSEDLLSQVTSVASPEAERSGVEGD